MKKHLLTAMLAAFLPVAAAVAQCPGTPNPLCAGTNGPCGSLSQGTMGQYYNDTISFFAPNRVDASAQSGGLFDSLDFVEFQILSVSGLPVGMTWSCGNITCIYNPQPSGILANLSICGTPVAPGTYPLVYTIKGTVSTPIGNQSQNQTYNDVLVIGQGSGSNSGFTFSPSQGCDSADVTLTPILNFPFPQITEWIWDLGNGNTFTGQNPPVQHYNAPGNYAVTCTTNVYSLQLTGVSASATGNWFNSDADEFFSPGADLYFNFTSGANTYSSPEVANNNNPSWSNLTVPITTASVIISFIENDDASADDQGGQTSINITGPGNYPYATTTTDAGYNGGVNGSITISQVLSNQIIVTDTVRIYTTPATDTIDATASGFCPYDSATLSVYPGMIYEWILNDTSIVQAGNDHNYTTNVAGNYTVKIIDPLSGCFTTTGAITLSLLPGLPPGFPVVGAAFDGTTLTTPLSGAYTYQWMYYDGINYSPVAAPEGTQASYEPEFNGTYCLIATNAAGCLDTSNCISIANLGMGNPLAAAQISIFPNPGNGLFTLSLGNLESELVNVNVFSMMGSVVHSDVLKNVGAGFKKQYALNALPSGIYIIELQSNHYRSAHRLVISR